MGGYFYTHRPAICYTEPMNYKTIRTIVNQHKTDGGFSFEYEDLIVSEVEDKEHKRYLRVFRKTCSAEGNGRPITYIRDECYPLEEDTEITEQNWKKICFLSKESIVLQNESYCGV